MSRTGRASCNAAGQLVVDASLSRVFVYYQFSISVRNETAFRNFFYRLKVRTVHVGACLPPFAANGSCGYCQEWGSEPGPANKTLRIWASRGCSLISEQPNDGSHLVHTYGSFFSTTTSILSVLPIPIDSAIVVHASWRRISEVGFTPRTPPKRHLQLLPSSRPRLRHQKTTTMQRLFMGMMMRLQRFQQ